MLEIMLAAAIAQGDFTVDVQNARIGQNKAEAIFKVTNHTALSYQRAYVQCVFFDAAGGAVDIGVGVISNLRKGEAGFGSASIFPGAREKPKTVACEVNQVTE